MQFIQAQFKFSMEIKYRPKLIVLLLLATIGFLTQGFNLQLQTYQSAQIANNRILPSKYQASGIYKIYSPKPHLPQPTSVLDQIYVEKTASQPLQFVTTDKIQSTPTQTQRTASQQISPQQNQGTASQQINPQQNEGTDSSSNTKQKTQTPPNQPGDPKKLQEQVGKLIIGKGFKADKGLSNQRIRIRQIGGKYLFFYFLLHEKDKWQKVGITLIAEESSTILRKCQYDGSDSCFVGKQSLKQNQVINVAIRCPDQCTYRLTAGWSNLQHLHPGDQLLFMFSQDKTQIYHLQIKDQTFEELRIHLAPRVTRRPFDNVKIFGKYGSQDVAPTPQNYDFKSVNLWEDGQGIFLTKQTLRQRSMMLLIIGQAETTYRLTCQLIKTSTHQIENGEHLYQYLEAGSSKSFKVSFDTKRYDQYSLRFSTLSGNLNVSYFTDQAMITSFVPQPFQYMKDSQYVFYSNQIARYLKDGLYIKIVTSEWDATYTIKFVGRKQSESVELNQHVYQFIPITNVKFAHFNFRRWAMETEQKANLKFSVSVIKVIGKVTAEFRVCRSTLSDCTNPDTYQKASTAIAMKPHADISQKQMYDLQIEDTLLTKTNLVQQSAVIIVRLLKTDPENTMNDLVALQFINNNKVLYLREGRPIEQKLNYHQTKTYKYINSDPNVVEIRVHLNQIAGQVQFDGSILSVDGSGSIVVIPQSNTLRFTTNLTQTILIQVTANSNAIFGLSMQIIHKNELTAQANVHTISEDLSYTVKIQPNSFVVFQVAPIFYEFSFHYSSSQSVLVCVVNSVNECVDLNKTEATTLNYTFKGEITQAFLENRRARVKIHNPFGDSVAQVTVIFHSRQFARCDKKQIGKVYSELVKQGSCLAYMIQQKTNTILDLYISKRQWATASYSILICGNSVPNIFQQRQFHIPPEMIDKLCNNSVQIRQISIIWSVTSKNTTTQQKQLKVDFLAQYRGDSIVLPQGISYHVKQKSKQGILKRFAFNAINRKDTKIIINQIKGKFIAYAKILRSHNTQTQISQTNYDYSSSKTIDYSQVPIILVPGADFHNVGCIDCVISIAVYSLQDVGRQIEFQIEVVQKYESLNDDKAVAGYLQAGSVAYYFYVASQQQPVTLQFLISDHNKQCANMYLDTSEYPSQKSNIANARGTNEMLYRHQGGQTKYFLSVEATNVCDYSILVKTIQKSIVHLQRGKQHNLKLAKDKIKYFIIEHLNSEPFKVISLTKYGELRLYLNISYNDPQNNQLTSQQLQLSNFAYNSDQLNILVVGKSNPVFCHNCDYFLAVQALKNTETTLYLAYSQTIIPLVAGKVLSDVIVNQNDYTLASYNNLQKTQLQIKVHSGSVAVQISYKEKLLNQTFSAKQDVQSMAINFLDKQVSPAVDSAVKLANNQPIKIERIPLNLMIMAKADDSRYTLEMISLEDTKVSSGLALYQSVTAGQPNHIQISSSKVLCLTGYLRDTDEELIITTNSDNQKKLNSVLMQAKINGEKVEINKLYIKNILSLRFNFNDSQQSAAFQLCLKLQLPEQSADQEITQVQDDQGEQPEQVTLKAILSQSNSVNILPSDTETIVKGSNIFIIHSDGQFLLDVFQCRGNARITYGNSLKNVQNSKMKMLDMVGMSEQRHAVKIVQNATTFIQIKSEYSIVRWFPINIQSDQGTGYLKYKTGDLKYSSHFKYINIEFQPLQALKKSNNNLKDIQYLLYLSNQTEKIQAATQCDNSEAQAVRTISLGSFNLDQTKQKQYITYSIEKQFLEKQFELSPNIYFSVVSKMTLQLSPKVQKDLRFSTPISDEHQHYRFIYSRQQVPLASYQQNKIQSLPYKYLLVSIFSLVVLLVVCYYVFSRKLVPLLGRLRTSGLVEEQNVQHKDDLEVPASSDRNQRATPVVIQGQDQMQK